MVNQHMTIQDLFGISAVIEIENAEVAATGVTQDTQKVGKTAGVGYCAH